VTIATPNLISTRKLNQRIQDLIDTARNGRIALGQFEASFPGVAKQIRSDADSDCFSLWGRSVNFDEYEKAKIVDPKILSTIGRLAKHPIREGKGYHAGLIHTYGYLLSDLKTRYGYKRERWTDNWLDDFLGLAHGTIMGKRDNSTLLQNASLLMARIGFRKHSIKRLNRVLPASSKSVQSVSIQKFATTRIEEQLQDRFLGGVHFFTDILSSKNRRSESSFLVYSMRCGRSNQKLITCFPISQSAFTELTSMPTGRSVELRPRYNVSVDGLSTSPVWGRRRIQQKNPD
jgi:hypothetical protein